MIKHNKKRNTLLIYEFLTYSLTNSLLENNNKAAKIKSDLIKKCFRQKTELHKEFLLCKAIAKAQISSEATLNSIFNAAKSQISSINQVALEKEKTNLINEIHSKIEQGLNEDIWEYNIDDYVLLATTQNLLVEYTKNNLESKLNAALFEDRIREAKLKQQQVKKQDIKLIRLEDKKIYNNITTRIIIERFNKKYNSLNNKQKELLKAAAFSQNKLNDILTKLRTEAVEYINVIATADNEISSDIELKKKLMLLKENIEKEDTFCIENIEKMLKYLEIFNFDLKNEEHK